MLHSRAFPRSYQAVEGFVSPVFAGRLPKFNNSKQRFRDKFRPSRTHNMSSSENNEDKIPNHGSGHLEISEKGFGFLRTATNHFHPKPTDIFVTPDTIRRNFLREGSHVIGTTQPPHRGTSPQLKTVEKVNDMPFEDYTKVVRFENPTTIDPIEKFQLETSPDLIETRVIDLVTPIGKGTRGIIVAPPRTGKTTILKQICNAITCLLYTSRCV